MRHHLLVGLLAGVFGLSIVGCAADTTQPEQDDEVSAEEAIKAGVKPGKFVLHHEVNHTPDPRCDSFTDLELKANGRAELSDRLAGRCALTAFPNPNNRAYTLRARDGGCGSKIYEGSRRVALGPAKTGIARIKITDHRGRLCMDLQPAQLIVEETVPGFPGPITTKLFSQDSVKEDIEVTGKLVRTLGIGGENTGASIASKEGMFELVLDAGERGLFQAGKTARVRGTKTTLSGVETHDRPAIDVSDMFVCPDPGFINCMPGPNVRLSRACGEVSWVEQNCPGVEFAF
jgi:hypothetical protein